MSSITNNLPTESKPVYLQSPAPKPPSMGNHSVASLPKLPPLPVRPSLPPLPALPQAPKPPQTGESSNIRASVPPPPRPEGEEVEASEKKMGFWKTNGKSILKAALIFGLIIGYTVGAVVALTACWPVGLAMLSVAVIAFGFYGGWNWNKVEIMLGLDPDHAYMQAVQRPETAPGTDPV